jgi:UDPglucose 6-dehydrogenase
MKIKIAMCGMTHLGLVYGSVFSRKNKCVFYDHRLQYIEELKKNNIQIKEKNLNKLLKKNKKNIFYSDTINDVLKCDIIFLSLDIETNSQGKSNYKLINLYLDKLKNKIKKKQTLIILSQLQPGFCRKLKSKIKSELIYFVETLVFGNAIERAMFPERLILGIDQNLSKQVRYFLKLYSCPILKMNYESAELTKISINLFLVSSVITTNLVSTISKSIGANWNHIKTSLMLDKRIGKYAYLSPGLGISGGNLERDLNSIVEIGKKQKIDTKIILLWQKLSNSRKEWINDQIQLIKKNYKFNKVGMLGLTYKPNTNSIKNSPSILTIKKNPNIFFKCHDPQADFIKLNNIRNYSIEECCKNVKVLIISTPWEIYFHTQIEKEIIKNNIRYVIDPFRVLSLDKNLNKKINYYTL